MLKSTTKISMGEKNTPAAMHFEFKVYNGARRHLMFIVYFTSAFNFDFVFLLDESSTGLGLK